MIYTKNFKFGSKELTLKTILETKRIDENIQFLLNSFLFELNHNNRNSSAERFNNSQINIPIFLEEVFIDFLKYNADFYFHFDGGKIFNPFSQNFSKLEEVAIVDNSSSTILKTKQLSFDSSFLRSSYIVELLKKFLVENKVEDYLIILPNSISAVGKFKWKCNFAESIEFKLTTFELENSNAFLVQNTTDGSTIKELIVIGKDLSLLKLLEPTLKKLSSHADLTDAAGRYTVDIVTIDQENTIEIFKGIA